MNNDDAIYTEAKLYVGSSTHRGTLVIVDPANTTAKDVVADSEFAALKGNWFLDGTILTDAEMNKPLTEVIADMNEVHIMIFLTMQSIYL